MRFDPFESRQVYLQVGCSLGFIKDGLEICLKLRACKVAIGNHSSPFNPSVLCF